MSPYSENALSVALANSSEAVYKTLVDIRTKLIKEPNNAGIKKLREQGSLKILLNLLGKPNIKIIDISLSILANCCLEEETRKEIQKLNGIAPIVTLLKGLETASIQSRACRALANLALDRKLCKQIHKEQAIPAVVNFLHSTRDPLHQQTAVRSLRIFADTPSHLQQIIGQEGLKTIAELLNSEDEALLKCLLKAMVHFTQNCSHQCAEQVLAGNGIQLLVNLSSHRKEPIRHGSVLTLVNLVREASIRPIMGNVGVIQVFINESNNYIEDADKSCGTPPAFALCLCTLEALNRKRIRENQGLKTLLMLLTKGADQGHLHDKIMDSLLNYIYDTESLKQLLEMGLISALIRKLAECIAQQVNEHQMPWTLKGGDSESKSNPSLLTEKEKNNKEILSKTESSSGKNYKRTPSFKKSLMRKDMQESNQKMSRSAYELPESSYRNCRPYEDFRNSMYDSWDYGHFRRRRPRSPGSASPEWIIPEPSPYYSREEEYFFMMRARRSPRPWSPMSTSPCSSPTSSNPCFSPAYNDFSEEEDTVDEKNENQVVDESNWRVDPPFVDNDLEKETKDSLTKEIEELAKKHPSKYCKTPRSCNTKDIWWWDNESENPTVNKILVLLARFSQMEKPAPILSTAECVTTLLNTLTLIPRAYSRAARIIQHLTSHQLCFEPLVVMNFPEQVAMFLETPKHSPTTCRFCSCLQEFAQKALEALSMQAKSQFGQRAIQDLMKKTSVTEMESAVLMVPYLNYDGALLHKYYIELEGLNLLLKLLMQPQNAAFPTALKSYLKLCLSISSQLSSGEHELDASMNEIPSEPPDQNHCLYETDNQMKDVCFILDDGETVKGNRMVLSRNCDVFEAMLQGSFSEALSDQVKFGDAHKIALSFVVHFLHGCGYAKQSLQTNPLPSSSVKKSFQNNVCPVFMCSVDDLLEVLYLSDRLLLPKLQSHVFEELIRKCIIGQNAVHIFKNTLFSAEELARAIIKEMSFSRIELNEKLIFFNEVLQQNNSEFIIHEIQELLRNKFMNLKPFN